MKKYSGKDRSARYLIALALAISTMTATPAHAAVVSFNCPTGGGTYQVDTGTLTGFTGTCSGDLTLDSSVTTIDTYAFQGTSLNTLTIPSTVTSILGAPFADGGNTLTAISVDASNPNYSSLSGVLFDNTQTELIVYPASKPGTTYVIPASVTSTRYYAFSSNKNLTTMNIPNTLTTLGGQAFISSTALTTVNIGTGLNNLGEQSFAWIPTLTSINVDASNTSFASIGGVLYNKNISKLWAYPANKAGTSYTAPNTVTSTAYTVFGGATNLLTVDLTPVATLSGQEFHTATSVEDVIFGNSLTILKSQVLQSASGLKKLTLGTGLTAIQVGAFFNNVSLNCVIYAGNNPTIQNYVYPNAVVPVPSSSNCPAAPNVTPWTVTAAQTSAGGGTATTTATQIVGANNYVELTTNQDYLTAAAVTVLVVSGSTITYTATGAGSTAGIVNPAQTEVIYADDLIDGNKVRISAATAGTVTAKYYERAVVNGVPTDTLKQTVTITVSAVKTWSSRFSTSLIANSGVAGVAGIGETDILAPKGPLVGPFVGVATVTVTFKDDANGAMVAPTHSFPLVRAVFRNASDPGNLSWGANGGNNLGRDVTVSTKAAAQTLTVFNDGWAGASTIDIYVDGTLWTSETLSFYGEVTTVAATQKLFVAPTTGGAHGCGAVSATCVGGTVALTPAVTLTATDAKGIKVPFLTFTATSSDTTVFASASTVAETVATGTGSYNANVNAIPNGTSGKTALITWKTLQTNGTTAIDSSATPTTYAIGGSAASIAFTVNASGQAGAKGTFTIDKKDSAGNKSADAVHSVSFKSNTAVTASIFDASSNTQTAGTSTQLIINGTKTWDFFNPLVDASVVFDVTVDGLLTGSQSFTVSTVSQAALDASQEAIDAANAATDAANAAAEAADAATAAAQDAADAVAALSTQVSEMIAALKKQITALTNLVIKIQKKVKA